MTTSESSVSLPVDSPEVRLAAPARSTLISRGVIILLLIVLAVEAIAYGRVTSAYHQVWTELQAGERQNQVVTGERIAELLGREPDESIRVNAAVGEERYDVYRFGGLLKRRELYVHFGVQGRQDEPEVVDVLMSAPFDDRARH
ncbi:MAG: hypothetical protein JNG89_16680 [Planctomycetaceae bacterium]|nr:hypothetical protein [Planctomycetaceae bacterium]